MKEQKNVSLANLKSKIQVLVCQRNLYKKGLFTPFAQEVQSARSSYRGTGLGMPIVKQLVEKMGGTLSIESELGEGSCFTVVLPFKINTEANSEEHKVVLDADIKGLRILLAEDNELNAEIAIELLHEEGFFVELATDGQECFDMLDQAEEGYYDLILMDIQMPNVNGYEATVKIRQMENDKKAQIPIVAMTANVFAEDRKLALDLGMNGHISKPIDMKKVRKVLHNILNAE